MEGIALECRDRLVIHQPKGNSCQIAPAFTVKLYRIQPVSSTLARAKAGFFGAQDRPLVAGAVLPGTAAGTPGGAPQTVKVALFTNIALGDAP